MLFKQVSHEIKDLDEKKGIVTAYANVYDNEDSDGDISSKGSFVKTVSENSKRIRVLKDHDRRTSLGVPINIDAHDPYGLKVTTQFNMEKEVSRDMYSDIILYKQYGLNAELSIGYEVIKRNKDNSKRIDEYLLMEYSHLTSWAANDLAIATDIKSIKTNEELINIVMKMYNIQSYSDTRLRSLENILKSLEKEPEESTLLLKPTDEQLIKSLENIFNKAKWTN